LEHFQVVHHSNRFSSSVNDKDFQIVREFLQEPIDSDVRIRLSVFGLRRRCIFGLWITGSIHIPASVHEITRLGQGRSGTASVIADAWNPFFRVSDSFLVDMRESSLVLYFGNDLEVTISADIGREFSFFVAAVTEANISVLPIIVSLQKQYRLDAFETTRVSFLETQLSAAAQFILSRLLAVPPFSLLPNLPAGEVAGDLIPLPGFAVYAFPHYADSATPAILCWTGNFCDVSWVHQCTMDNRPDGGNVLLASPSSQGRCTTSGKRWWSG
jgi:hypothetical protein